MLKENKPVIDDALRQSLNEYLIDHYTIEEDLIKSSKLKRAPKKRSYSYSDDIIANYLQTPDVSDVDDYLEAKITRRLSQEEIKQYT